MSHSVYSALLGVSLAAMALAFCGAAALVGRWVTDALGLKLVAPGRPQGPALPGSLAESLTALPWGLRAFLWMCTGLAVWNAALVVVGLAGALRPELVALLSIALVTGAVIHIWRVAARSSAVSSPDSVLGTGSNGQPGAQDRPAEAGRLELWGFACLLTGLVWWCVRPPGMWDDTSYHLPYARHYLEQGGVVVNPWLRFPLFPHNPHLLFAVALMTGGDAHAQILAGAVPLALTALGLFSLTRHVTGSTSAGGLALGGLASFSPLREAFGYAYVDHLLMLWVWAAGVCLWLAGEATRASGPSDGRRTAWRWILLCGLMAGMAAGTKTFGGLLAFLIGLTLLVLPGLGWRAAWRYALAVSLVGGVWYVRSWLISGDPFHPLGGSVFGHYLWNAADLAAQHEEQATHGVSRSLLHLPQSLRAAGLLLLAPALLAPLLARPRQPMAWAFAAVLLAFTLIWHGATQVARYSGPVLPIGSFLLGCSLAWGAGRLVAAGTPPLALTSARGIRLGFGLRRAGVGLAALVMGLAAVNQWAPMQSRLRTWDDALLSRPGVQVFREAATRTPQHGTVLVQLGYENATYFFPGQVVGDWFGPGRYTQMLRCTDACRPVSADDLAAVLERHGARMVAIHAKRFAANPQDYRSRFEVAFVGADGFLLTLKDTQATR